VIHRASGSKPIHDEIERHVRALLEELGVAAPLDRD
jgi:hypothetical protein